MRVPWPSAFPKVFIHAAETAVKQHVAYMAAKAGDAEAAVRLVMDTISDEAIRRMVDIGSMSAPILISVHAEERAGVNAIPEVFADILGHIAGWEVEKNVVQANVVNHTGASGFARLAKQAFFEGEIRPAEYIIVDDFVGQGGTIANLRGHLSRQGGRVLCAVTLTGKAHSGLIFQGTEQLNELRNKHGQLEEWWRNRFGFGFECLTASETRYLINTPTSERIRDCIETAFAESSVERR
ncbi:phosphoribosyltransferase [Massilia atriviolacea]|uniref:Phosphoribosyltransferase n=1 Tax=Massilia atriviolacea TaxID=2495579 RepID=A0A430HNJ5_9BURK|nr:phosphoribosyltransferase [Massilia atriviolacea]